MAAIVNWNISRLEMAGPWASRRRPRTFCPSFDSQYLSCSSRGIHAFCFDPKDPYSFNECLSGRDISGNYSTSCDPTSLLNGSLILTNEYCPSPYSWLTLLGLCLYIFFFGPGMGPMPWTINSELFPLWSRSVCYSITTAFNWFFNLLVSSTFLTLTETMTKQGAFWLYSLFGVIGFVFLFLFLPETKGRSLEADIRDVMDTNRFRNVLRSSSKNRQPSLLSDSIKGSSGFSYTEGMWDILFYATFILKMTWVCIWLNLWC